MNINEFEALQADSVVADRVASRTFYEMRRAQDPYFSAAWALVPGVEKEEARDVGFAAILALVDDYTTPGCDCGYCTWEGKSDHGRPIMCRRRWDILPPESRRQISESASD